MLHIFTGVMDGLVVYPERMKLNLERTQGLVFSQKVLLALIESGMSREGAYKIVQRHSMAAWDQQTPFRALLETDPEVTTRLDRKALDKVFDYGPYLMHIDSS